MEVRLIADGEEQLSNDFHNTLYNDSRTLQQWQWAFVRHNYDKTPKPYVVVEDNGKIVGTQAFIPIRMIDKDGVFWTAKSEGTLLDPEYRGKQLFKKMYDLLFAYADEHQFAWIWGFTALAVKALIPLGFQVPNKTTQIFMPFSSRSIPDMMNKGHHGRDHRGEDKFKIAVMRCGCGIAQTFSAIKLAMKKKCRLVGCDIRTMEKPDEQTGDLCRRFINKWGGTTIYRDAEYLQWRLYDNPYARSVLRAIYRADTLLGWVAFTLGDDGLGYLVDLMIAGEDDRYSHEDLVRALLVEAILGTRNMGATGIRGWHVNNHAFDKLICRVAKQLGFYHISRGHSAVLYNCEAGKTRASCYRFDDWYVSRIYTEGVLG